MNTLQHVPLSIWGLQAGPLFASALARQAHPLTVPGSWGPRALALLMFNLRLLQTPHL